MPAVSMALNGTGVVTLTENPLFKDDSSFKELFLFHEYYNADTGEGLGASHQTGWTSLVAKLLQQTGGGVLRV